LTNDTQAGPATTLSVIVPVYDEEAVLPRLFDRLYPVLDRLGSAYEVVFVDDGSRDRSPTLLRQQHKLRPDVTRVLLLRNNAGQHPAIMAGFEASKGARVVTLDADLQNPPEEIPSLLAEMDRGHDYVGSIRRRRRDDKWRDLASNAVNRLREGITGVHMTDQGCMLRAYDREIVEAVLASHEARPFIPALAYLYAVNPTEITVDHEERAAGESKYPLYKRVHLYFDLVTGFSQVPLQVFSLVGIGSSLVSFLLVIYLVVRWLIVGPEGEGVYTLLGILFFFAGVILFGIGLLGEYVGRIYQQSRGRPQYPIREHLRPKGDPGGRGA
jgi:undecaprenyl-phosphate 4-deoxy-4-formamido-L-arabinose transferase